VFDHGNHDHNSQHAATAQLARPRPPKRKDFQAPHRARKHRREDVKPFNDLRERHRIEEAAEMYHYGFVPPGPYEAKGFFDWISGVHGAIIDPTFGWPPSGGSAESVMNVEYEAALLDWELESEVNGTDTWWGRVTGALQSALRRAGVGR
jgi:hypothetical protein